MRNLLSVIISSERDCTSGTVQARLCVQSASMNKCKLTVYLVWLSILAKEL